MILILHPVGLTTIKLQKMWKTKSSDRVSSEGMVKAISIANKFSALDIDPDLPTDPTIRIDPIPTVTMADTTQVGTIALSLSSRSVLTARTITILFLLTTLATTRHAISAA